jgi:hypothetical protein
MPETNKSSSTQSLSTQALRYISLTDVGVDVGVLEGVLEGVDVGVYQQDRKEKYQVSQYMVENNKSSSTQSSSTQSSALYFTH